MGTKQVQTNQYAAAGMGAYNQLTPQAANSLSGYINNPFQSTFFQQMLGMGNAQIGQQGQTQTANLLRNNIGAGSGGANPYLQSLMAQQGRAVSGQQAGLFQGLLGQANTARQWATGTAAGFRPLQTGQTQQTSGLGTWLPQLVGAGIGAAAGFATGGASTLGSSIMHGTMGAMNAAMSPMQSPFLGNQFAGGPMGQNAPQINAPMPGSGFPSMFGQ